MSQNNKSASEPPVEAELVDVAAEEPVAKSVNAEVFAAVEAIREEVGTLARDQRNSFGNFNFASIDQFYQKVVPIAAKHGIQWIAHNCNPRPIEITGGKNADGDKAMLLTDVSVDLRYRDGTVIRGYMTFTLIHQIIGAQTSLSVISYADKAFMRSAFKIPTEEADQDALDNSRFQQTRGKYLKAPANATRYANATRPALPSDYCENLAPPSDQEHGFEPDVDRANRMVAEGAQAQKVKFNNFEMNICKRMRASVTVGKLEEIWATNQRALGHIKTADKERYDRIVAAFAAHKNILLNRAKAKDAAVIKEPNGNNGHGGPQPAPWQ